MNYFLGIDIGGTNIKGLAVSASGRVLAETAVPTKDDGTSAWKTQVRRVFDRLCQGPSAPERVGLAAPGLPAKNQASILSMPGRLPGLEGLVWQEFLRAPDFVPVLNDAQAALLGEVWRGAARGAQNALLLTLGTGVGGAALVDGHLLRGHLGRAGHLGHLSLDVDGRLDILNTPGSLEDAIGECTVRERSQGRFRSTKKLVEACRHGEPFAKGVWLDSVKKLAASVASFINVLDPEVVVIGGGIAQAGPTLFRPLAKFLDRFEWRPGGARVRVVRAKLNERAGAFGAAWNVLQPTLRE
jgi:glucokinase